MIVCAQTTLHQCYQVSRAIVALRFLVHFVKIDLYQQ
jgi:hypothetical protein